MKALKIIYCLAILATPFTTAIAQSNTNNRNNTLGLDYSEATWSDVERKVSNDKAQALAQCALDNTPIIDTLNNKYSDLKSAGDDLKYNVNQLQDNVDHLKQKIDLLGNLPELEDKLSASKKELEDASHKLTINADKQEEVQLHITQAQYEYNQKQAIINAKFDKEINHAQIDYYAAQQKAAIDKTVKHYQSLADAGDPTGLERMSEYYREGYGVDIDLAKANKLHDEYEAVLQTDAAKQMEKENTENQERLKRKFLINLDLADKNNNVQSMLYVEHCYRCGIGTETNFDKADEYHLKAVSAGIPTLPNRGYLGN